MVLLAAHEIQSVNTLSYALYYSSLRYVLKCNLRVTETLQLYTLIMNEQSNKIKFQLQTKCSQTYLGRFVL